MSKSTEASAKKEFRLWAQIQTQIQMWTIEGEEAKVKFQGSSLRDRERENGRNQRKYVNEIKRTGKPTYHKLSRIRSYTNHGRGQHK